MGALNIEEMVKPEEEHRDRKAVTSFLFIQTQTQYMYGGFFLSVFFFLLDVFISRLNHNVL